MNLLDGLLRADGRILALHQRAYDYAWDRWGLHVGTFRFLIVVLSFSDTLILTSLDAISGKTPLASASVRLILTFGIIWIIWGINHLGEEWRLQAEGKYAALNASALRYHGRAGLVLRAILFAIVPMLGALFMSAEIETWRAVLKHLTNMVFMGWGYSLGVLVRDREPDRFLAPAPNAA